MINQQIYTGLHILNVTLGPKNTAIAQLGDVLTRPAQTNDPSQPTPSGEVEIQNANWFQHAGFCSIPSKAIPGSFAPESMYLRDTHLDVVFASRDIRSNELYGTLVQGETAMYAPGINGTSQGIITIKTDGSLNLVTKNGNTSAGAEIKIKIAADDTILLQASTVYGGDLSAVPLTYASAFSTLQNLIKTFATGLTTVTLVAQANALASALPLTGYATTKFKGT